MIVVMIEELPAGEEGLCVDAHGQVGPDAGLGIGAGQEPAVDVDVQLAGETYQAVA